jgi:glycosyltransferase involved in cell wall biosynthesis
VGLDVSIVMPCYNESGNVPTTVPRLVRAFANSGVQFEIIPVDNGSVDDTWAKLGELAERFPGIVNPVRVETNIGYGNGILQGMHHARGGWLGTVAADGQVDAEDVFRLYEACADTDGKVVGKVRRRYRMDGFLRRVISVGYNVFVRLLWPRLGSWDVNGQPRMLRREIAQIMDLQSTNWLLDPEMLIKAHYMNVRVIELNVFARMRGNGVSHVRMATCVEFFTFLLGFRFSGALKTWRRRTMERAASVKLSAS